MSDQTEKYAIIKRVYDETEETNKLELLATREELMSATRTARRVCGNEGDIVIVCDINDVSDLINKASLLFIIGSDGLVYDVPNVEEFTGVDVPNWIKLWEETTLSPEGAFWISLDCGIDKKIILTAVYECVDSSFCKFSGNVARCMRDLIDGKINKENLDSYLILLDEESEKIDCSREERRAISAVTCAVKTTLDFTYASSAITMAHQHTNDSHLIFREIFRKHIKTKDLMLCASRQR